MVANEAVFIAIAGEDGVISIPDVDKYAALRKAQLGKSKDENEKKAIAEELKALAELRKELQRRGTNKPEKKDTSAGTYDDGTMTKDNAEDWKG